MSLLRRVICVKRLSIIPVFSANRFHHECFPDRFQLFAQSVVMPRNRNHMDVFIFFAAQAAHDFFHGQHAASASCQQADKSVRRPAEPFAYFLTCCREILLFSKSSPYRNSRSKKHRQNCRRLRLFSCNPGSIRIGLRIILPCFHFTVIRRFSDLPEQLLIRHKIGVHPRTHKPAVDSEIRHHNPQPEIIIIFLFVKGKNARRRGMGTEYCVGIYLFNKSPAQTKQNGIEQVAHP